MKTLKKMSDFCYENQNEISNLEKIQIRGGRSAECCNETHTTQCPDGQGTDTESWIYNDAGGRRVPVLGTLDGQQVYP
jgi:hypothetical protein